MRWLAIAVLFVALALGCKHKFDPVEAQQVRASALAIGARAPEALLASSSGGTVALSSVIRANAKTVVVFYRGFY